jgi:ABC-type branched-subunit amino acid transport system substrate-binding protein
LNARVTPLISYAGVVIRETICRYGYKNVGIFATDDDSGARGVERLLEDMPGCPLTVLAIEAFPSSTVDFTTQIASMKAAGAKIFVTLLSPSAFAPLMEQGYAAGLFDESSQIFGGIRTSDPAVFAAFKPTSDIPAIMKGKLS